MVKLSVIFFQHEDVVEKNSQQYRQNTEQQRRKTELQIQAGADYSTTHMSAHTRAVRILPLPQWLLACWAQCLPDQPRQQKASISGRLYWPLAVVQWSSLAWPVLLSLKVATGSGVATEPEKAWTVVWSELRQLLSETCTTNSLYHFILD